MARITYVYLLYGNLIESKIYSQGENSYYDIFHNEWMSAIEKEAKLNKKFDAFLKKVNSNDFSLHSDDCMDIITDNNFFTCLIYKDKKVYRRIFRDKKEAITLAEAIKVSKKISLQESNTKIEALKSAFVKALPHELGHYFWKHLTHEQKEKWQDILLHQATDIDYNLLEKGYPDKNEKLDEEAFCSYLNTYVCPDAKNLSGAVLVPEITEFLKKYIFS